MTRSVLEQRKPAMPIAPPHWSCAPAHHRKLESCQGQHVFVISRSGQLRTDTNKSTAVPLSMIQWDQTSETSPELPYTATYRYQQTLLPNAAIHDLFGSDKDANRATLHTGTYKYQQTLLPHAAIHDLFGSDKGVKSRNATYRYIQVPINSVAECRCP